MIAWIGRWWRRRQREIDARILWPSCANATPSLDMAKAAFMLHATNDPAWTTDYTDPEIIEIVDGWYAP